MKTLQQQSHLFRFTNHASSEGEGQINDVSSKDVYVSDDGSHTNMSVQRFDDSSQLTLSFRDQVYVFDSLTSEMFNFPLFVFPVSILISLFVSNCESLIFFSGSISVVTVRWM